VTTPTDIVTGALVSIGAQALGDVLDVDAANFAFTRLNDLLDQISTEHQMTFATEEIIHELTAGQYTYSFGPGGSIGAAFTASINGTTLLVNSFLGGALSIGQTITGTGVAAGTTITALGTGQGGNGTGAIGSYSVNITQTVGSVSMVSTAPRPIRISSAFVRIVNSITGTLDYPVAVISVDQYESIGIKTLPGPWPRAVYYQPTMPVGMLNYWPNPASGEMHLFCDMPLTQFLTLTDQIVLPQGYKLAFQWILAESLMPLFPATAAAAEVRSMVPTFARQARAFLKKVNQVPQTPASFDDLPAVRGGADAGWIMHGGFN
jgi:hypothetical protein